MFEFTQQQFRFLHLPFGKEMQPLMVKQPSAHSSERTSYKRVKQSRTDKPVRMVHKGNIGLARKMVSIEIKTTARA